MGALVLKLKGGDRVTIGEDVILDCKRASDGTLRLAIIAPDSEPIGHEKHRAGMCHPDAYPARKPSYPG